MTILTPEQATQALADMTANFHGSPPTATPTTPAEAHARIAAVAKDKSYYDKLTAGDVDTRREWSLLQELASRGDQIEAAMSDAPIPEIEITNSERPIPTRNLRSAVEWLRDDGIRDEVTREFLSGRQISPEERAAVEQFQKTEMHGDAEWVKRFLNGGQKEKRQQTLASIVLASEIEKQ